MIVKAAVKIYDYKQAKTIIIPCHRHCDAFYILHQFGYKQSKDFEQMAQGFLDEHDNFYTRIEAKKHAQKCHQIIDTDLGELFSEDLW